MKFQIVKGSSATEPYFWRIVSSNGQTLAASETYVSKSSARDAIDSVIAHAAGAEVEDLT